VYTYTYYSLVDEMDTRRDITERADVTNRHALRRNQETDNPCYKVYKRDYRMSMRTSFGSNTSVPVSSTKLVKS